MPVNRTSVAHRRRGRRPGISTSRQAILDAARARFARDGYTATTVRQVAADAGVDASLVIQFFHSKDELFAAVISIPPDSVTCLSRAFDGPTDQLGERVVRAFLDVWEGAPADSESLMAMLRGAVVNQRANTQLREFIQARLLDTVGPRAVGDDAALRAGLASSMLVGLVMGRRIVGIPVVADADTETLVALVAPAIQSVLASEPSPPSSFDHDRRS